MTANKLSVEWPGARLRRAGCVAVWNGIELSSYSYVRERDLSSLVGLGDGEAKDRSSLMAARLLRRIGRALRRERVRGRAGRGDYDLARHLALLQAWRAEARGLGKTEPGPGERKNREKEYAVSDPAAGPCGRGKTSCSPRDGVTSDQR